MMMNIILYSILCISVSFISGFELQPPSPCKGPNVTSDFVKDFCYSIQGHLKLRCCILNDSNIFVAIDLMDANLTVVPDFSDFHNFNLSLIDLRSNPLPETLNKNAFVTLLHLDDLILPYTVDCPGGLNVWETINRSIELNETRCMKQKSICSNSTKLCIDEHSFCVDNGPNNFVCSCKDNYHDYKCLRQGTFPTVLFFSLTGFVTVIASIFFYWTQRRHVKK